MNKTIRRTDMILNNIDNKTKNTDDLNNIKTKNRVDGKNYNSFKNKSDTKNNNKLKDIICDSKYINKNISDSKNNNKNIRDSKISNVKDVNKIKDRGDLKIIIKPDVNRMKKYEFMKQNIINPDGDTQKVTQNLRSEKFKTMDCMKQSVERDSEDLKAFWNKRTVVRNVQTLATVDLKRIRDRYTMKLRNPSRSTNPPKKENCMKTELKNVPIKKESKGSSNIIHIKEQEKTPHLPYAVQKYYNLPHVTQKIHKLPLIAQKIHELPHIVQKSHDLVHVTQKIHDTSNIAQNINSSNNTQKHHDLPQFAKKIQDLPQVAQNTHDLPHTMTEANEKESRKKPVIRTVMTKNGSTRIYKAVTFEETKTKPTSLEINIPNDSYKKSNSIKSSELNSLKSKVTVSKISVKDKKVLQPKKCSQKRDRKHRRHVPSRDYSVQDLHARSPPTEVAKWAPTSITSHTKPYYEAWVDTTLTAVHKNEKLKNEKISILKCLQQALERPDTPELLYCNYADERYAGRIKITHPR